MTPKQMAQDYAETIYGPANGWGQHVSKRSGLVSHAIMWRLYIAVGQQEANQLIDEAMKAKQ
jgi:hypothetical protein